jgi:hypothetical protein
MCSPETAQSPHTPKKKKKNMAYTTTLIQRSWLTARVALMLVFAGVLYAKKQQNLACQGDYYSPVEHNTSKGACFGSAGDHVTFLSGKRIQGTSSDGLSFCASAGHIECVENDGGMPGACYASFVWPGRIDCWCEEYGNTSTYYCESDSPFFDDAIVGIHCARKKNIVVDRDCWAVISGGFFEVFVYAAVLTSHIVTFSFFTALYLCSRDVQEETRFACYITSSSIRFWFTRYDVTKISVE